MAIPPVQFSHVGLYVGDMAAMELFYTRFLGFAVTDRGNLGPVQLVFLSRDAREHHQIVLASGRPEEARFSVINQISLRVDDLGALRYFRDHAGAHGASDVQPVTHGNALSLYLRDPELNRIELFLDTPWYVTQPLREPLDLSLPDEEIWRRAEAHARKLPGFRPVGEWQREFADKIAGSKGHRP